MVNFERNAQSGFSLLEAVVGMAIMATAGVGVLHYISQQAEEAQFNTAATQFKKVSKAAELYLKDNYSQLASQSSSNKSAEVTLDMLKRTNYLADDFPERNPFGQTYQMLTRQPAANQLDSVVMTVGGEEISELGLRKISSSIGATGGYISKSSPTKITGAYQGWNADLHTYGVGASEGHIASSLYLADGSLVTDYLYRRKVPGHPELNAMSTDLNMASNNIDNAGNIGARNVNATSEVTGRNVTASENVKGRNLTATDDVKGHNVAASNMVAGKNVSAENDVTSNRWVNSRYGGGWYMSDSTWLRSIGNKSVYTGGEIKGGKITSDGRLKAGEYLELGRTVSENSGCSPNGLVARDRDGKILSCQSGRWKPQAPSATMRMCRSVCGGDFPVEVGRLLHEGDWPSFNTYGVRCTNSYTKLSRHDSYEAVFCSAN